MSRRIEILALILGDALASAVALSVAAWGPAALGWIPPVAGSVPLAATAVVAGWVLLFAFSGLYAERYARGRLDELVTLAKVIAFGCLALLFGVVVDRVAGGDVRATIGSYALAQFAAVGGVRLVLRAVQRALVVRGYGRHRAVVVGWSDRVEPLYHDLARYPAANIEIVGALRLRAPSSVPVLAGDAPGAVTITERFPGGDALPAGAIEVTAAGAP